MQQALLRIWRQRGPLAWLLWPLSLPYRALLALRALGYRWDLLRARRLPVPVVVVGNVMAGGTGGHVFPAEALAQAREGKRVGAPASAL